MFKTSVAFCFLQSAYFLQLALASGSQNTVTVDLYNIQLYALRALIFLLILYILSSMFTSV